MPKRYRRERKFKKWLAAATKRMWERPLDPTVHEWSGGPYLRKETVVVSHEFNPKFGDEKLCQCGHEYYRHFDSSDHMSDVGCKYCPCDTFEEIK